MKILITSQFYYPEIGGLNPIAQLSAREFIRRGHEVRLLTGTAGTFAGEHEFPIFRREKLRPTLEHYRWCDVVFQNHITIRYSLPLLFVRRPYVVSMTSWMDLRAGRTTGKWTFRSAITNLFFGRVLRHATRNIAACPAIAAANRVPARIIPNPFDADGFRNERRPSRSRDLLFIGRLVTDKGVDDLLRALATVRKAGFDIGAVIAGNGGELGALTAQARDLGLAEKVRFVGPKQNKEVSELMNSHRLLVVPSKWNEPIGIVALEAIACGCVVIGSEGGGLATTIGPCGLTYPNGDHRKLAEKIIEVLRLDDRLDTFTSNADSHLARYRPERICGEYLEELTAAHDAFSGTGR